MVDSQTLTLAYLRLQLLSSSFSLLISSVVLISLLRLTKKEGKKRNTILCETNTVGPSGKQSKTTQRKTRWWVAPGRSDRWWMNMWSGEAIAEEMYEKF